MSARPATKNKSHPEVAADAKQIAPRDENKKSLTKQKRQEKKQAHLITMSAALSFVRYRLRNVDPIFVLVDLEMNQYGRLVEVGAQLGRFANNQWVLLDSFTSLVKPDGWTISKASENIHGISIESCRRNGKPIRQVLTKLQALMSQANAFVAHNALSDSRVLREESRRYKIPCEIPMLVCTMECGKDITRLEWSGSGFKYPKLSELYAHFFRDPPRAAHRAMQDVQTMLSSWQSMMALPSTLSCDSLFEFFEKLLLRGAKLSPNIAGSALAFTRVRGRRFSPGDVLDYLIDVEMVRGRLMDMERELHADKDAAAHQEIVDFDFKPRHTQDFLLVEVYDSWRPKPMPTTLDNYLCVVFLLRQLEILRQGIFKTLARKVVCLPHWSANGVVSC